MAISKFHRNLLGKEEILTPELFRITERQLALYEGFLQSGARGYSTQTPTDAEIIATLVLGLYQTNDTETVVLAVSGHLLNEVKTHFTALATHIFSERKSHSVKDIQFVYHMCQKLMMGSRILSFEKAPDKWVAIGFEASPPTPDWMTACLIF